MTWLDYVNATASVATAVGVIVASWQIILTKQQARTQFEDELVNQYREIIRCIPVEALLGKTLMGAQQSSARDAIYRYIDLSNQQIFLRQHGRASKKTWENWQDGIESHLNRQ